MYIIYCCVAIYLYIVHVYLTCNFHVHQKPIPVPKQNNGHVGLQPRKKMAVNTEALDGYKVAIFAYGQTGRDVGCRMDGFLLGNLPRETLTARDAPWKHLGFFVEDEFLLKGKEDY